MKLREYITTFDGAEVRVTLPESLAQRVEAGEVLTIRLKAGPGLPATPRYAPQAAQRELTPCPSGSYSHGMTDRGVMVR